LKGIANFTFLLLDDGGISLILGISVSHSENRIVQKVKSTEAGQGEKKDEVAASLVYTNSSHTRSTEKPLTSLSSAGITILIAAP